MAGWRMVAFSAFVIATVASAEHSQYFAPSAMYMRTMVDGGQRFPDIDLRPLLNSHLNLITYLREHLNIRASADKCARDLNQIVKTLPNLAQGLWAWKYVDAWPKIPSGVQSGNIKWHGDFDLCLSIPKVEVAGSLGEFFGPRYCYTGLTGAKMAQAPLHEGVQQSFPAIMLGLCVTTNCDEQAIINLVNPLLRKLPIPVNLTLHQGLTHCQDMNPPFTSYAYIAITVYSVVAFFLASGLILDIWLRFSKLLKGGKKPEGDSEKGKAEKPQTATSHFSQLILSFSPLSNFEKLVAVPQPCSNTKIPNFTAINGIRTLSLFWVMLGHFFPFHTPVFDNILESVRFPTRTSFQFVVVAYFAVDTFLFLAGFLAYWSIARRMTAKSFNFLSALPLMYFHRWIRIAPPFYAVILLDLGLWAYLHNGPFYFQGTDYMCETNWWANLLFIHNLYHSDEECVPWTWYLAADMQMFIFVPFAVYAFVKLPVICGWIFALAALVAQIVYGAVMTEEYNLPASPQRPANEYLNLDRHTSKNHPEYDKSIYVKPYSRMGPYIVGVIACHLLVRHQEGLRKLFNKVWFHAIGWPVCFGILLSIVYSMVDVFSGDRVDPNWVDCIYNGVARIAWGIALAWILLACSYNRAGPVGNILNWNLWSLPARLSYSAYLLHPFVYLFFVQTARRPAHATDITIIYMYCGGVLTTLMVSTLYVLAFESPLIGLTKGA